MYEAGGFNAQDSVELASNLRIRQKLGQISSSRLFQKELVPRIANLGGQTLSTEDFLSNVSLELTDFAEQHILGITALALSRMPEIIENVIENEDQRQNALNMWTHLIKERCAQDDSLTSASDSSNSHKPSKLPRKRKKSEHGTRKRGPSNYRRYRRRG